MERNGFFNSSLLASSNVYHFVLKYIPFSFFLILLPVGVLEVFLTLFPGMEVNTNELWGRCQLGDMKCYAGRALKYFPLFKCPSPLVVILVSCSWLGSLFMLEGVMAAINKF